MNEILEVDYVIEMFQIEDFAEFGVISSDGLKVVVKCKTNYVKLGPKIVTCLQGMYGISILEKITDEEKFAIENDFDPIEAPPGRVVNEGTFSQIYYLLKITFYSCFSSHSCSKIKVV